MRLQVAEFRAKMFGLVNEEYEKILIFLKAQVSKNVQRYRDLRIAAQDLEPDDTKRSTPPVPGPSCQPAGVQGLHAQEDEADRAHAQGRRQSGEERVHPGGLPPLLPSSS